MTFLLSEDKALRLKLQGMVVHDQKSDGLDSERPVGVWFGRPDQEIRAQTYPYVTIDMIDINRDTDREMRGLIDNNTLNVQYLAPENPAAHTGWEIHRPIPVSIDYQITTYARHPRHDREILSQIMGLKLPIRFGSLALDDGTVRRLDVMNVTKRDVTEQAKRLFVNAITVRVSSELVQDTIQTLHKVLSVHMDTLESTYAGGRPGNPDFISTNSYTISS
jgi:hypothetical protein